MAAKKEKPTLQAIVAEELHRLLNHDEMVIQRIHQIAHQIPMRLDSSSPQKPETQQQKSSPVLPNPPSSQPLSLYEQSVRLLCLFEMEKWFRAKPYLFSGFLRQPKVVSAEEMQAILQQAVEEKLLSSTEITALGSAALLIKGKAMEGEEDQLLVIQLALHAEASDVERAFELTTFLRKLGLKAAPLVASPSFSSQARQLAKEIHVALLEDVLPISS